MLPAARAADDAKRMFCWGVISVSTPLSAVMAAPRLNSRNAPASPYLSLDTSAATHGRVSLSEVLAALSRALDLTSGAVAGHSARSCAIAVRLGEMAGLDAQALGDLHYAMLLKDAGCSSNAARMAALFGADDQWVKPRMKATDWQRQLSLAFATVTTVGRGRKWSERLRLFTDLARSPDVSRELIQVRCERGAAIARGLGFGETVALTIRSLDEHWCGLGYPDGLRAEKIPLLSRLANLAQVVEVVHAEHGVDAALAVARKRSKRWFDPRLVAHLETLCRDRDWWEALAGIDANEKVAAIHSPTISVIDREAGAAELDGVALAFADIIDAKSPYTSRHSRNVASYARSLLAMQGANGEELARIYRAGLLHDIGKLGVSNLVLDKPGRLDEAERAQVELHPLYSWEILSRVRAFGDFALDASAHHEKLDGSGYPWGLKDGDLSPMARTLAVADIYEALTADRPYRAGLASDVAVGIVLGDRGTKLCPVAVDALVTWVDGGGVAAD